MEPDHSGRPAVVVEGPTDRQFYQRLLEPKARAVVIAAGGRHNTIQVVKEVDRQRIPVVGIVDADDDLTREVDLGTSVIATDARDVEAMIFHSAAGDRVMAELYDSAAVSRLEEQRGVTLREALVDVCAVVGAARRVNHDLQLGLNFKDRLFLQSVDQNRVVLDTDEYLRELIRRGGSEGEIGFRAQVEAVLCSFEPAHLVGGHDLTELMSHVSRGSLRHFMRSPARDIERMLRVSYTADDFKASSVYSGLLSWGERRKISLVA